MAQRDQDRLAEAIQWRIQLRDAAPEDWEAFVQWLEEDPERSAVYDAVVAAEATVEPDMIPVRHSPAAFDNVTPGGETRRRRGLFYGSATAFAAVAAIVLFAFVLPWLNSTSSRYEIATGRGHRQLVAIGDGSSIAMNGESRIVLDRRDPRYAELKSGEAAFTIRHDNAHPFTLVAGDHRLQDAGTRFNVLLDEGLLSVEVAEGAIVFDPAASRLSLGAGETLAVDDARGRIIRGRQDPKAVSGWRRGQLSFKHASLAAVARGLSRSIGMDIKLDPAIAERPFTGTIRVDGDPSETMARLAATLDLEARRNGAGWLIEPSPRARR
jgi:transmembrane sensor